MYLASVNSQLPWDRLWPRWSRNVKFAIHYELFVVQKLIIMTFVARKISTFGYHHFCCFGYINRRDVNEGLPPCWRKHDKSIVLAGNLWHFPFNLARQSGEVCACKVLLFRITRMGITVLQLVGTWRQSRAPAPIVPNINVLIVSVLILFCFSLISNHGCRIQIVNFVQLTPIRGDFTSQPVVEHGAVEVVSSRILRALKEMSLCVII